MQCPHWRDSIMRIKVADLCSNQYRCESCTRSLPASDFYKSYLQRGRLRCRQCVSRWKTDPSPHSRLLNTLRKSESKLNQYFSETSQQAGGQAAPKSKLTLSLVRELVSVVWREESALQRSPDDGTALVLVRWDVQQPFSKTNNIALSVRQAARHYNTQLNQANARELLYGSPFCNAVDQLLGKT